MARKTATYYRATAASLRSKNNLGRLLKLSYTSLNRMIDEYVAPLGLTAMQWKPLVIICHQNTNTPAELARRAFVDTGAMTRTLDRLEAKGFLRRQRCDTDRRVVNLELTDAGRDVVNDILPAVAKAFNAHLAGFTDQEIDTLFTLLGRLIDNGSTQSEHDSPEQD
jgi:DNA-binding MarR family transcriptional regulator